MPVPRSIGALILVAVVTSAVWLVPTAHPTGAYSADAATSAACPFTFTTKPGLLSRLTIVHARICTDTLEAGAVASSTDVRSNVNSVCGAPGDPSLGAKVGPLYLDDLKVYEGFVAKVKADVDGYFKRELSWYDKKQKKVPPKTRKKVVPILTAITGNYGLPRLAFVMSGYDAALQVTAAHFSAADCGALATDQQTLTVDAAKVQAGTTLVVEKLQSLSPFAK